MDIDFFSIFLVHVPVTSLIPRTISALPMAGISVLT
jgi:hypothetical protein